MNPSSWGESRNEWVGDRSSTSAPLIHQHQEGPIEINGQDDILSTAFLVDGEHIVSGSWEGKVRRWQVEDGKEMGRPMNAGDAVYDIAVSQDGKWIVSGTRDGFVTVWDARSHEQMAKFEGHKGSIYAVDVSRDGTRIATGSYDKTACIWSTPFGRGGPLLGPLKHDKTVGAVKFSPDGRRIATASWEDAVRVYDNLKLKPKPLVDLPICVCSVLNRTLTWTSDSRRIFVLSRDGNINCIDAATGTTCTQWPIHSSYTPWCISLANNGTFIAAFANSSVTFWDTTTYKQIGSVIQHTTRAKSMAMSAKYDLVIGGEKTITLRNLCDILPSSYFDGVSIERAMQRMKREKASLENFFRAREENAKKKVTDLEIANQQLRKENEDLDENIRSLRAEFHTQETSLSNIQKAAQELGDRLATTNREKAALEKIDESLRADLRARNESSDNRIAHLEEKVQRLTSLYVDSQHRVNGLSNILGVHEKKDMCEALYADGHIIDAAIAHLDLTNAMSEEVRANGPIMDSIARFKNKCVSTLETIGDEESSAEKHDEATVTYSTALLLGPSVPDSLLTKWAKEVLICSSVNEALSTAAEFNLPTFFIYRTFCDVLEEDGRVSEAMKCFLQMHREDTRTCHHERAAWEVEKLEKLGDIAMEFRNYNESVKHFSATLSLDLGDCVEILVKRSKARASNSWQEALSDADEAIKLDPSSYRGYEQKYAVLRGARRHAEAVEAFRAMLSRLDGSSDEHICQLRCQYVDATPTIRDIVKQTIRLMPTVLIDTATGFLRDKKKQAEAFEALPAYNELVLSMTTKLDPARILREVNKFYRYVMLSHRWEENEPLLQEVENVPIYGLEASPETDKLQKFCLLVRSRGFRWAWSDTCCVDKTNNVVLQESLVAMFAWYRNSSLTVVYLRGVSSESQLPDRLQRSVWNTRAWTFQEYVAAKIIQFYTEDWKLYLGLTLSNHKKSPVIISEMQRATGVSAKELDVLRPGFDRIREKLHLASSRQTTLVEDFAYSLLGIFNISMPIIYGEGIRAVGRLLEHILAGSGDGTILAWTGRTGEYNSCLPVDLAAYNQVVPPHIPQPIETTEMEGMVTELNSSLPDPSLATMLYNELNKLPSPTIYSRRLQLPCILFHLPCFSHTSGPCPMTNLCVYHTTTPTFGDVEIQTLDNLTRMKNLCLVHPWIHSLFDEEFLTCASAPDKMTQALRLVARLRQPFGALLLEPVSRVEYRRVATDSLIRVQVREEVSLNDLIDNIRTVEVQ